MPEHTGTVAAKSQYGIKFSDNGPWFNWTLPEKRGTPFDEVEKGDKVRIEYDSWEKKDGGKGWNIYVIENISHPGGPEAPVGTRADSPFPPEEAFPGDESGTPYPSGLPLEPFSEPAEATLDTDRLIVRQVCVKAACEALAISPLDSEEKAGRITYLAGVFEDWIYR